MEEKLNQYGIILDGKMDESVWMTAEEHTGFKTLVSQGNELLAVQTAFKIISCEDRIFVGIKCYEPLLAEKNEDGSMVIPKGENSVELFLSPSGNSYEFYQFVIGIKGGASTIFYSEGGNTRPDVYRPDWNYAVYVGEGVWSVEMELPLTAFYWTGHDRWSDTWLLNIARSRPDDRKYAYSTWSPLQVTFIEPKLFRSLGGFPVKPMRDDVCIYGAVADLTEETPDGYKGNLKVTTINSVADAFTFTSDRADTATVKLEVGTNEFAVPCCFDKLGRVRTTLSLTRRSDGKVFKRYFPVLAEFEPIKIKFTLPEYRTNFYPGQDYSKIVGTVKTTKPVTLTLEGPGIEKTVVAPGADGTFIFETPNFEVGEAILTAAIDGYEIMKKIRRIAPTGRMMTWISGGNLIVDGKPTMQRNMFATFYRGGTALDRKFVADNFYDTKALDNHNPHLQPARLIPGSEAGSGESLKDQYPSEEMLRKVDEIIEKNKDRDFCYYYISDEPECRGLSPVYLKYLYEYAADKDPYHVIMTGTRAADRFVDIADWFGVHPYLNPITQPDGKRNYQNHPNTVGGYVDQIGNLNRSDKCVGFVPTCFTYKWQAPDLDYPTFDEYILHTWAAMMRGGKSIWPYAYHDLNDRAAMYEGTRYIFSSFAALEDIVLLGKRTTLSKSADAEAVLYELGEEKMFVLVNFMQEEQTVVLDGLAGTWHEFRGDRTFTGSTFTMRPMETIVGTNAVKGADLPTYAQTKALIDAQEYKRTHTDSLLFNRTQDVTVSASPLFKFTKFKLLDGTPDNYVGTVLDRPDNFLELNVTKVKPTVHKVILRGFRIEDARLKIRVGDELTEPAVTETTLEEYAKTYILAEAVTPDALRFEFDGKKVEIYGIEAF